MAHGTAANERFMKDFAQVIEIFLDTGSPEAAASAANVVALQSGIGR